MPVSACSEKSSIVGSTSRTRSLTFTTRKVVYDSALAPRDANATRIALEDGRRAIRSNWRRDSAPLDRMERALMEYRVGGIKANLAFHRRVLREADFRSGKYSTAYIEGHKDLLAKPISLEEDDDALDAALAAAALHALEAAPQPAAGNGAATTAPSTERSAWQRNVGF